MAHGHHEDIPVLGCHACIHGNTLVHMCETFALGIA